jgi:hypothetical protein
MGDPLPHDRALAAGGDDGRVKLSKTHEVAKSLIEFFERKCHGPLDAERASWRAIVLHGGVFFTFFIRLGFCLNPL